MPTIAERAQGLMEYKAATVRHVRTVAGERRYKQPIGSIIVNDSLLIGLEGVGVGPGGKGAVVKDVSGKHYLIRKVGNTRQYEVVQGDSGKGPRYLVADSELEAYVELAQRVQTEHNLDTRVSGGRLGDSSRREGWSANQVQSASDEISAWGNSMGEYGYDLQGALYNVSDRLEEHRDIRVARHELEQLRQRAREADADPRNKRVVLAAGSAEDTLDSAIALTIGEGKLKKRYDEAEEAEYAANALMRHAETADKPKPVKTGDLSTGMWVQKLDPKTDEPLSDWFKVTSLAEQSQVAGRSRLVRGIDRNGKRVDLYRQGPRDRFQTLRNADKDSLPVYSVPKEASPTPVVKKIHTVNDGQYVRFTDVDGQVHEGYVTDYGAEKDDWTTPERRKNPVYKLILADDKKGTANKRTIIVPRGATSGPAADTPVKVPEKPAAAPEPPTPQPARVKGSSYTQNVNEVESDYEGYDKLKAANGSSFYLGEEDGEWTLYDADDNEVHSSTDRDSLLQIAGLYGRPDGWGLSDDLDNIRPMTSDYDGFSKVRGRNGKDFYSTSVPDEDGKYRVYDENDKQLYESADGASIIQKMNELGGKGAPTKKSTPAVSKPSVPEAAPKKSLRRPADSSLSTSYKKLKSKFDDWDRYKTPDGRIIDVGQATEDDNRWYATGKGGWDDIIADADSRDELHSKLNALAGVKPAPTFSPSNTDVAPRRTADAPRPTGRVAGMTEDQRAASLRRTQNWRDSDNPTLRSLTGNPMTDAEAEASLRARQEREREGRNKPAAAVDDTPKKMTAAQASAAIKKAGSEMYRANDEESGKALYRLAYDVAEGRKTPDDALKWLRGRENLEGPADRDRSVTYRQLGDRIAGVRTETEDRMANIAERNALIQRGKDAVEKAREERIPGPVYGDMPVGMAATAIGDMSNDMDGLAQANAVMIARGMRDGLIDTEGAKRVLRIRAKEMEQDRPEDARAFRDMADRIEAYDIRSVDQIKADAELKRQAAIEAARTRRANEPVNPSGTVYSSLDKLDSNAWRDITRKRKPLTEKDREVLNIGGGRNDVPNRLGRPATINAYNRWQRFQDADALKAIRDVATDNYISREMTPAAAWKAAIEDAERVADTQAPKYRVEADYTHRGTAHYAVKKTNPDGTELHVRSYYTEREAKKVASNANDRERNAAVRKMTKPSPPDAPRTGSDAPVDVSGGSDTPVGGAALDQMSFRERADNLRRFTQTGPEYSRGVVEALKYAGMKYRQDPDGAWNIDMAEAEAAAGLRPREDVGRLRNDSVRNYAAQDRLTATGGVDPKTRLAAARSADDVDTTVRQTIDSMNDSGDYVGLEDLRGRLESSGLTRTQVDESLRRMARSRTINLDPDPDRRNMSDRRRQAAVDFGGEDTHLVAIRNTDVPRTGNTQLTSAKAQAVYTSLGTDRTRAADMARTDPAGFLEVMAEGGFGKEARDFEKGRSMEREAETPKAQRRYVREAREDEMRRMRGHYQLLREAAKSYRQGNTRVLADLVSTIRIQQQGMMGADARKLMAIREYLKREQGL